MNRQQITWLIVRAFGLYLLVQAFLLLPELLAGLFAARYYANIMSSLGSESGNVGSSYRLMTSLYRSLAVAPFLRMILYSAVGIYMLRGGRFLVRLLERVPDTATDVGGVDDDARQIVGREQRGQLRRDVKQNLTEEEAGEMSFKERLSASGLFQEFADAVERRDVPELERILRQICLPPDSVQAVIEQVLGPTPSKSLDASGGSLYRK